MSRRTKQSARIVAPVVVDLDLRSQEEDGYEFDDMSRRTSSKERESRVLPDEETVPDDNDEIKRVPVEEIEESQGSQTSARRQQPTRLGYRTKSDTTVIDMKAPEDTGFEFREISYTTPKGTTLLKNVSATIAKGEMLAIMGPPGSGSTSVLASLTSGNGQGVTGQITFEGQTKFDRRTMSFVPKGDVLLGSLTVREMITFALRLEVVESPMNPRDMNEIVNTTIGALGLTLVENVVIGNVLQKGISETERRKVTLGTSLVAYPKVLILEEPEAYLDASSARVVMTAVKQIARETGMIVIASIRHANYQLLQLFDNLLLLGKGQIVYSDKTERLPDYLASLGYPVPHHSNPADFLMDLMNADFNNDDLTDWLTIAWKCSQSPKNTLTSSFWAEQAAEKGNVPEVLQSPPISNSVIAYWRSVFILTWRGLLSYMRNLTAYGIRLAMYVLVATMIATIFVRIGKTEEKVTDRLSVHFYVVALLSLMSAAGVPSFLEERAVFRRERKNGLYSSLAYTVASSITSLPFLMGCTMIFTFIMYWAVGLNPKAAFKYMVTLWFTVIAAESQVILFAALIPNLIMAIGLNTFVNVFWMSVGGYLIRPGNIPVFWYCWAHWVDFQKYAYQLLINYDLRQLAFPCKGNVIAGCSCSFPSSLIDKGICAVSGEDVLTAIGMDTAQQGLYLAIIFGIALVFRALFWTVLVWKK